MAQTISVGDTFGRLKVVEQAGAYVNRKKRWLCRCECGGERHVSTGDLNRGHSRSCGCLQKEKASQVFKTHGWSGTPEHDAYKAMLGRCRNPKNQNYATYGGRGIEVRYATFEEFLADIGPRPSASLTVDRIDVDGHYEAGNCRWATRQVQGENRRTTITVEVRGERRILAELCRNRGLMPATVHKRIARGWDVERALSTPPMATNTHTARMAAETNALVHVKRKPLTKRQRLAMFLAHGGKCCICKGQIDGVRERWIDEHILALELGGDNAMDNRGPAHERCAKEKTKKDHSQGAKGKRQAANHLAGARSFTHPLPGSRNHHSGLRRRMNGKVERWT